MDNKARIYVEFAPDLKEEVGGRLSLQDVLDEAAIPAQTAWSTAPPTDPDRRGKALVETVAVGSLAALSLAGSVAILTSAVSRYLERKAVRDTHFEYWVSDPVLDPKGKAVLDPDGQPLVVRRRIGGFDAIPTGPAESLTITVGKALGVGVQSGGPAGTQSKGKTAPE